jgi:hypothetical protein
VQVLANIVNANPGLTGDLLPLLAPAVGAGAGAGIGANPGLIVEALSALNPAIVANALNAHPEITEELSRLMPPSLAPYIASGVSANPAFLGELLKNLNPAPVAAALGAHTGLVFDLVSQLPPSVVAPMIRGSNRNPDFLASVLSHLEAGPVAGALNDNPAFLETLLSGLMGSLGTASAQGMTDNWLAGRNFLSALVGALNPAVIAGAVNANPAFLEGFLANSSSLTAEYLARGINQNVVDHPFGQDLLSVLITNISPAAAAALAAGINQNVAANPADNLLTGLLANTNGSAGVAIATGLNNNPAFVRVLVENITPATAIAAAQGINFSCQRAQTGTAEHPAAYYQFLRGLLANLGSVVAEESARGLTANPNKEALIAALVNNLNAGVVAPLIAAALDANAASQTMLQAVMGELDATTGHTIALALNANPDMTSWMLEALDAGVVADLLNDNSAFLSGLISNLDGVRNSDGDKRGIQHAPRFLFHREAALFGQHEWWRSRERLER